MISSNNMPAAFAAVATGTPENTFWDMLYDGVSHEQAMDNMYLGDSEEGMGWMADISSDEILYDSPDAVDMAIYQNTIRDQEMKLLMSQGLLPEEASARANSKVDSLLTPHGPGLTLDELESINLDYPGAQQFDGVDPYDYTSYVANVEDAYEANYKDFDEIIDWADDLATQQGNLENTWDLYTEAGNRIESNITTHVLDEEAIQSALLEMEKEEEGEGMLPIPPGALTITPGKAFGDIGSWMGEKIGDAASGVKDWLVETTKDFGEATLQVEGDPMSLGIREDVERDIAVRQLFDDLRNEGSSQFIENMSDGLKQGWINPDDFQQFLEELPFSGEQHSTVNAITSAYKDVQADMKVVERGGPIEKPMVTPTPAPPATTPTSISTLSPSAAAALDEDAIRSALLSMEADTPQAPLVTPTTMPTGVPTTMPTYTPPGSTYPPSTIDALNEDAIRSALLAMEEEREGDTQPVVPTEGPPKLKDATLEQVKALIAEGASREGAFYIIDQGLTDATLRGAIIINRIMMGESPDEAENYFESGAFREVGPPGGVSSVPTTPTGRTDTSPPTGRDDPQFPSEVTPVFGQPLDYYDQFRNLFNQQKGSGDFKAQELIPHVYGDIDALYHLQESLSERHGGVNPFGGKDVPYTGSWLMGEDQETYNISGVRPSDENRNAELGAFKEYASRYMDNPNIRTSPKFYADVEQMRDQMSGYGGLSMDETFEKLWTAGVEQDSPEAADIMWRKYNFMDPTNNKSINRLSNLLSLYHAPPGADRHTKQKMNNQFTDTLYGWISTGRTMEDFFTLFARKTPSSPTIPLPPQVSYPDEEDY